MDVRDLGVGVFVPELVAGAVAGFLLGFGIGVVVSAAVQQLHLTPLSFLVGDEVAFAVLGAGAGSAWRIVLAERRVESG